MTPVSKDGGGPASLASVAALVLAAGSSKRSRSGNKLLLPGPGGEQVVRCVVRALAEAGLPRIVVVTGHEAERICGALQGLPVEAIWNPRHRQGMGSSLASGLRYLGPHARGYLVTPADLPWLSSQEIVRVLAAFDERGGTQSVVPVHGTSRGHPVLLRAALWSELLALEADRGARELLEREAATGRTHHLKAEHLGGFQDWDEGDPGHLGPPGYSGPGGE